MSDWSLNPCAYEGCGLDEETHELHALTACEDADCGHGYEHHVGAYRDRSAGYCCVTGCPCASYMLHNYQGQGEPDLTHAGKINALRRGF